MSNPTDLKDRARARAARDGVAYTTALRIERDTAVHKKPKSDGWTEITANGLWPAPHLAGGVEGPDRKPPREEEVEICRAWIKEHATPAKKTLRKWGSHGLKHRVEDWTGTLRKEWNQVDPWGRSWSASYHYVSNGAFIEAARREGYQISPTGPGSPNAYFDMNLRPMKSDPTGRMFERVDSPTTPAA